jgi:hypothetical protein
MFPVGTVNVENAGDLRGTFDMLLSPAGTRP